VHASGMVDLPFPHPVRDALLAEGLAEEHRSVPDSGWITFHVRSDEDFNHAVWLMRLSYLRYAMKAAEPSCQGRISLLAESSNSHGKRVSGLSSGSCGHASR
jgi:hypothetical protein